MPFAYTRILFFPAMNSRTLDRVMHLTRNRAVAADFTFDTPLNRLFVIMALRRNRKQEGVQLLSGMAVVRRDGVRVCICNSRRRL